MGNMTTRLLTLMECEARTGRKVSTWRKAIARREIPFVKIGRNVRIPQEFIEDLVAKGWREPVKQPTFSDHPYAKVEEGKRTNADDY